MLLLSQTWHNVFVPTHSVLEMCVRGLIMYLAIFALLRFVLKCQTGGLSTPDILLVVLLADAAQNGLASEYRSVTEGIIVVCTIVFWNFANDWLQFPQWNAYSVQRLSSSSRMVKFCGAICARRLSRWMS